MAIGALAIAVVVMLVLVGGTALVELRTPAPSPDGSSPDLDTAAGVTPDNTGSALTLEFPDDPGSITLSDANFYGWSLIDRTAGRVTGSTNASSETSTVESMIKPWLAADYLRRLSADGEQPDTETLDELTLMIEDSNDPLAERYYQLGGSDEVVLRLRDVCALDSVGVEPGLWGMTTMTPLDAARYGLCLADGRAAGPQWTGFVLEAMRHVRGGVSDQDSGEVQGGRWGIIDALPPELARDTAIKNGWTAYEDGWHVNCLAIHPEWVLSVMIRMPDELPVAAAGCATITSSLLAERRA